MFHTGYQDSTFTTLLAVWELPIGASISVTAQGNLFLFWHSNQQSASI